MSIRVRSRSEILDSWIKKHLGSVIGVDVDALKKENEDLKKANAELTQKVEELNKKVIHSSSIHSLYLSSPFIIISS
jgi:cell division protein FtsB